MTPEAASMRAVMFACFVAGWECSGEGWNGEFSLADDDEEALREKFAAWSKLAAADPGIQRSRCD